MNEWRIAKVFHSHQEAYLAKARLESLGIEARLNDEHITAVNVFYMNAVGGVKFLVKELDMERSVSIIGDGVSVVGGAVIDVVKKEGISANQCPFCDSDNIGRRRKKGFLSLLLMRKTYFCYECWKEWTFVKC